MKLAHQEGVYCSETLDQLCEYVREQQSQSKEGEEEEEEVDEGDAEEEADGTLTPGRTKPDPVDIAGEETEPDFVDTIEADSDFEWIGWTVCKCGGSDCDKCQEPDLGDQEKDDADDDDDDSSADARKAAIANPKRGGQFVKAETTKKPKSPPPVTKRRLWIKGSLARHGHASQSADAGGASTPAEDVIDGKDTLKLQFYKAEAKDVGNGKIAAADNSKLRPPFDKINRNKKPNRVAESYLLQAPGDTKRYSHHVHSQ